MRSVHFRAGRCSGPGAKNRRAAFQLSNSSWHYAASSGCFKIHGIDEADVADIDLIGGEERLSSGGSHAPAPNGVSSSINRDSSWELRAVSSSSAACSIVLFAVGQLFLAICAADINGPGLIKRPKQKSRIAIQRTTKPIRLNMDFWISSLVSLGRFIGRDGAMCAWIN